LQKQSTMMDLTICQSWSQIPHSMISRFGVAPCGFHSKSIAILRVYIIKYSNLWTMNASIIRWSMVASKLEHGRPCCNLLDAAISVLQLS
jgi:hypothetical protein